MLGGPGIFKAPQIAEAEVFKFHLRASNSVFKQYRLILMLRVEISCKMKAPCKTRSIRKKQRQRKPSSAGLCRLGSGPCRNSAWLMGRAKAELGDLPGPLSAGL